MKQDVYHNIRSIPLAERETFNNTILLLTMVKSRYYYILGFSRAENCIELAFDYDSQLHSVISQSMTVDFGSHDRWVLLRAEINHLSAGEFYGDTVSEGTFRCDGDRVVYEFKIPKDRVLPVSVDQMNRYILKAKSEIIAFVEGCYEKRLGETVCKGL